MNYDSRPLVVGNIELIERYWKIFLWDDTLVQPRTEQIIEVELENGFEDTGNTGTPEFLKE